MKTKSVVFALVACAVLTTITAFAQGTNTTLLPGLTPTGDVDVVSLINIAILALTPMVVQGIKKVLPLLPVWSLNLLAPVLGATIGFGLQKLHVDAATGWGAALWGGAGTWLYELSHNVAAAIKPANTPESPDKQ